MFLLLLLNAVSLLCSVLFGKTKIFCLKIPLPKHQINIYIDKILRPIAQKQSSYLKDTTDYINFTENTKFPQKAILISMDITSLYTTIPPTPSPHSKALTRESTFNWLIFQESSTQFMKKNYLQGHETKALGPKMAVAFANIFMAKVQMQIQGKGAYLETLHWLQSRQPVNWTSK